MACLSFCIWEERKKHLLHPLSRLDVVKRQTFGEVFSKKSFSTATKNWHWHWLLTQHWHPVKTKRKSVASDMFLIRKKESCYEDVFNDYLATKNRKFFGDHLLTVGYSTPRCVPFEVERNLDIFPLKNMYKSIVLIYFPWKICIKVLFRYISPGKYV